LQKLLQVFLDTVQNDVKTGQVKYPAKALKVFCTPASVSRQVIEYVPIVKVILLGLQM